MSIQRIRGDSAAGRSKSSRYEDLIWIVATASDEKLNLEDQTTQTLASLDESLAELESSKTSLISAQVFIANIDDKQIMDNVWRDWIGDNPDNWPQRACLGVELGGNWLIEITVVAVKDS